MLIVFKIFLVALAVFGQTKLFPERTASAESGLDSLVLPEDKPELALAKRAMEAQGLCPALIAARDSGSDSDAVDGTDQASDRDVASICF